MEQFLLGRVSESEPAVEGRCVGTVSRCRRSRERTAPGGERAEAGRFDVARRGTAFAARPRKLLADLRGGGKARLYGRRPRYRARAALFRRRYVRSDRKS